MGLFWMKAAGCVRSRLTYWVCLALCVWQRLVGWGWDGRVQAELHGYSRLLQLWCVSLGEMGGDVGYWKNRSSRMLHKDVHVCVCLCVCVGAEAGTGAGQTIGPRGSCIVPYCQLSPSAAAGFWWMRCWINNSRNPCHSAVIAIQRPGSAFAPVHRWPDGATRCSL